MMFVIFLMCMDIICSVTYLLFSVLQKEMNARLVFNDTEPAIPSKLIVIDGRYKMMDSLNNLLQFMTSMFAVNCSLFD